MRENLLREGEVIGSNVLHANVREREVTSCKQGFVEPHAETRMHADDICIPSNNLEADR